MLDFGAANVQEDSTPLYEALMLSLMMQNLVFFLLLSHALYSSVESQQCEHSAVKLVSVIQYIHYEKHMYNKCSQDGTLAYMAK